MSVGRAPQATGGLIGRAADVAAVRAFLRVARKRGGALLLCGEPGVGKSALLDVAARTATAGGTGLVRVSGVQAEADLDYSILNQLLVALHDCWLDLPEQHRDALSVALGLGPGFTRRPDDVVDATVALLCLASLRRPILVIVDDAQWIDRASAAVLAGVGRRLEGSRAGLLGALRPGQSRFVGFGWPHQEVPPLPDEAAAQLVSSRCPAVAAAVLRRLLVACRGNPLSLLELAELLTPGQLSGEDALPAAMPLSSRLRSVFAARLATIPPAVRRILLLAALDGTGELDVLLAAANADPVCAAGADSWADVADELDLAAACPDRTGHRFAFRHPLVRSAVIEASTGSERQSAHRVLAGVLRDPDRRAWHLADAVARADESVAATLEQAAHRAMRRGDPISAVGALLRAADLSPDGRQRSRRLSDAAYLRAGPAGNPPAAAELLTQARCAAPGQGRSLHAAVAAALSLLGGDGDVETAGRMLAAAICEPGASRCGGDDELVDALHYLLEFCLAGSAPGLWGCLHAAAAGLPPALASPLRLLVATLTEPVGSAVAVLPELDAAIAGLDRQADPLWTARIGLAALSVDRMQGCRNAMWQVVGRARAGIAPAGALPVLQHLCLDDFFTGRWDELAVLAREGLDISSRLGLGAAQRPFRAVQAVLAAVRGDHEVARAVTEDLIGWAAPRGATSLLVLCHYARGLAALGQEDYEQAYREADAMSAPGMTCAAFRGAAWVTLDLAEAAVRTGRHGEAAAHVAALRRARVAELSPRAALLATAAAAVAASGAAAGELFERALAVPGAPGWPFEFARVQLAYGEHLRRARATIAARAHLGAARAAFDKLAARPWAVRAAAELRAAGARPDAGSADVGLVSALTPQERRVVSLAAAGLSSQQIAQRLLISRRTVDVHLYRAFPKLGIKTRSALRDALDMRVSGARSG